MVLGIPFSIMKAFRGKDMEGEREGIK